MSLSINYSSKKLMGEFFGRSHIRGSLQYIKDIYNISDKKIIELGCGLGENLKIFIPDNEILGFEGLADAAKIANENGINVQQLDLDKSEIPLDDESTDVVLCMDVLEHLVCPECSLQEAWRILRKGGIVVINVPNHFTLSGRVRILFGSGVDSQSYFPNYDDWNNPHVRFFRHDSIIRLLEKNKFSITNDLSGNFPAIPGFNRIPRLKSSILSKYLTRKFPNLFASGFFVIASKN